MFILVPTVNFKARLDLEGTAKRAEAALAQEIKGRWGWVRKGRV